MRAAGYGKPLGGSQIRYDKAVKCKFKKKINLQPSMVKGGERVDRGLPHGSAGTESTCDAGNTGYSPKVAKSWSHLNNWACASTKAGRQSGETGTHTQGRPVTVKMEAREVCTS